MVKKLDPSSQRRPKPDERRRPTLQSARDYLRDVAGTESSSSSSKDAKPKTTSQETGPGVKTEEKSRRADSRQPRPAGSVPNTPEKRVSSSTLTETFTHLRRNAVSDGIPYGDYRYLTGGRSEYECLEDAHRQNEDRFRSAGQETPAQSRNVSTETVWEGAGRFEEVDETAKGNSSLEPALKKGKERRSSDLVERGAKRQG